MGGGGGGGGRKRNFWGYGDFCAYSLLNWIFFFYLLLFFYNPGISINNFENLEQKNPLTMSTSYVSVLFTIV